MKKGKIALYCLWILAILTFGVLCILYPEITSPDYLSDFIKTFHNEMLFIYIVLSFTRGFFLIPSTPFVIAGGLLFPNQLLLVLGISMAGILLSSTAIYYFSDFLGFSEYLDRKFSSKVNRLKSKLTSSKSIFFIAGWSIFPFVPTDLICYATGVLKTPFKHMIIGVFIGELILCSLYVYFGARIFNFF